MQTRERTVKKRVKLQDIIKELPKDYHSIEFNFEKNGIFEDRIILQIRDGKWKYSHFNTRKDCLEYIKILFRPYTYTFISPHFGVKTRRILLSYTYLGDNKKRIYNRVNERSIGNYNPL